MNKKLLIGIGFLFTVALLFMPACESVTTQSSVDESLDLVEEVSSIEGAKNATITVNLAPETYFGLNFSNINANSIISNGDGEGWCIDWQKPIDSDGGVYTDIQLYSTYNVESWQPINYLFNIIEQIKADEPKITYREIQVAIWSMRGNPVFDLDSFEVDELPSRMQSNGEPNFDRGIVDYILKVVDDGYRDFVPTDGTRFAVIAETPVDVQTVITVVEK